jgi:uncharacterized membrane protein YkvA (DUF1232 family)
MGKFIILKTLLQQGKLTLRLVRDPRVPLYAKAVLGLTLIYVLSPLDFVPDWIPLLGQLDDAAILTAGIALFIRLCPPELVEQPDQARRTVEGRGEPIS